MGPQKHLFACKAVDGISMPVPKEMHSNFNSVQASFATKPPEPLDMVQPFHLLEEK